MSDLTLSVLPTMTKCKLKNVLPTRDSAPTLQREFWGARGRGSMLGQTLETLGGCFSFNKDLGE